MSLPGGLDERAENTGNNGIYIQGPLLTHIWLQAVTLGLSPHPVLLNVRAACEGLTDLIMVLFDLGQAMMRPSLSPAGQGQGARVQAQLSLRLHCASL